MDEEVKKGAGTATEMAQAVAAVAKEIPIYQDLAQPAARELGRGLAVVAKTVTICLAPLELLVWGLDEVKGFIREQVSKKLENVPPEDIQQPKPHIAVPAIEALRYTGSEETLSDLYANLLANSMDKATAYRAHPGFVDMIKNMCPDEARIMRHFAMRDGSAEPIIDIHAVDNNRREYSVVHRHLSLVGVDSKCDCPVLTPMYLDNLERLGLLDVCDAIEMTAEGTYSTLEESGEVKSAVDNINERPTMRAKIARGCIEVTDLGRLFIRACVTNKGAQSRD